MFTYETTEIRVGHNKGAPRVWLEGKRIEQAGFSAGTKYELIVADRRVTLTVREDGTRIVSGKQKQDGTLPVIDINSAHALGVFEGLERLRVVIRKDEIHLLPLATQKKVEERLERVITRLSSNQPLRVGSLCHGGGVLSLALHEGLQDEGVASNLVFANDIDAGVLFHAAEHNPAWSANTAAIAGALQEIIADDWLIEQIGHVEVLEAGLPCVAASLAGRAKKGLAMAEADRDAGHLVVPFLALIQALQPAIIVLENVPPYQGTASAHLIRHTLRDWGYEVHETVLGALDFGSLEDRKRMALVAMTRGLAFDIGDVAPTARSTATLGDVLEDIPLDAPCWSSMDYLRDKEQRDIADGKGFRMAIVGPEATRVGTIGKAYQKNRSTEAKVRHPVAGDALLRLLTPIEHARIKGVPESLIHDLPATRAHELLGNGICIAPFKALAQAIARSLRSLKAPALAKAA